MIKRKEYQVILNIDFQQLALTPVNILPRPIAFWMCVSEDHKFRYSFFVSPVHGPSTSHLSELNIPEPGMQCYSEKDPDYVSTYSLKKLQAEKNSTE